MALKFVACDREQELLLPPSLREWLPENHLAWFVIDAVAQFDLTAFYAAYRRDGHGRPAHDPAMMVALLLYGYGSGNARSHAQQPAARLAGRPAGRGAYAARPLRAARAHGALTVTALGA